MKVAICNDFNKPLEIEDVLLPDLGENDVRVHTDASGVCHTDLSMIQGMSGLPMPMVLGHEGAGTVVEVGKGVTRCKVGDRVIMSWAPACGVCYHCVRHESNHCESFEEVTGSHGVIRKDGSLVPAMAGLGTFSEMMQASELSVVPVNTDLPADQLAMIGCGVTTGVGSALWTAKVRPGSNVAVFGCGGVGLSVIQGARIAGAVRIYAIDPMASKREIARQFGATDVIDPEQGDVVEQLLTETAGRGVDYAFEVTGIPDVVVQAFHAVRKNGTAVAVGMSKHDAVLTLPATPLWYFEKKLIGSLYGSAQVREHFPVLVKFAEQGKLDLESMISARTTLDKVNEAIDNLKSGHVIRTVIMPSD